MRRRFTLSGLALLAIAWVAVAADSSRTPPGAEVEGDFPFAEVIQRTTGHEIVTFDGTNAGHAALLEKLKALTSILSDPLRKSRM